MNKLPFNIKFPYYCSLIDIRLGRILCLHYQHRAVFDALKASACYELASMPDSLPRKLDAYLDFFRDHQLSRTYHPPSLLSIIRAKTAVTDQYLFERLKAAKPDQGFTILVCPPFHQRETSRDCLPAAATESSANERGICWSVCTINMVLRG